jgi:hypothetical protein
MPKIAYVEKNFSVTTLGVIDQANEIIEEYEAQGFTLTLRQLYYQFVARGFIENTQQSYKRLGEIISDARLSGMIDWEHLEDRTRALRNLSHWDNPQDIMAAAASSYHIDMWERQRMRLEVWIEKDALLGVFERICNEYDIPYFSCRGYTSQTEMWKAAQRLMNYADKGQDIYILHFGDHDPSGRDMTRDITDRLDLFCEGSIVDVNRMALNWDQVETFSPPPNPAKLTDSRANAYIAEFGPDSWELDAMEPAYLAGLVRDFAEGIQDQNIWDEDYERREVERKQLRAVRHNWDRVQEFLRNGK